MVAGGAAGESSVIVGHLGACLGSPEVQGSQDDIQEVTSV